MPCVPPIARSNWLVAAVLVTACGAPPAALVASPEGDAGGVDGGEPAPSLGGLLGDPLAASDASVPMRVDTLFRSTCAGGPESFCHGRGAGKLTLRIAGDGGDVVDVASTEDPTVLRVVPFDPSRSYLLWKVEADGGARLERMPLGGPYDPRIESLLRDWITAGALAP